LFEVCQAIDWIRGAAIARAVGRDETVRTRCPGIVAGRANTDSRGDDLGAMVKTRERFAKMIARRWEMWLMARVGVMAEAAVAVRRGGGSAGKRQRRVVTPTQGGLRTGLPDVLSPNVRVAEREHFTSAKAPAPRFCPLALP
jgi:hypothetical protein